MCEKKGYSNWDLMISMVHFSHEIYGLNCCGFGFQISSTCRASAGTHVLGPFQICFSAAFQIALRGPHWCASTCLFLLQPWQRFHSARKTYRVCYKFLASVSSKEAFCFNKFVKPKLIRIYINLSHAGQGTYSGFSRDQLDCQFPLF